MTVPPATSLSHAAAWLPHFLPTTTAFQPIVDVSLRTVYAHEALVRGMAGESAVDVFKGIPESDLDSFDQICRIGAIHEAARVGIDVRLHLNFLPNSLRDPSRSVESIIEAASIAGLPLSSLTFELVEVEKIADIACVAATFDYFRSLGFLTALDDFGEGSSGLNLLSEIRPDIVKLDLRLIHGIDSDLVRETIVAGMSAICCDLDTILIAEGIETETESALLLKHGIHLQQGYLFARPAFRSLARPWK